MICRHCGTEIADKALICYRCGAATTDPQFKPHVPKRGLPWLALLIVLALLALIVGVVVYLDRSDAGPSGRLDDGRSRGTAEWRPVE